MSRIFQALAERLEGLVFSYFCQKSTILVE